MFTFLARCFLLLATVNSVIITTKLGKIEGITRGDGIISFNNIPYAKPPINELRFQPPQPITKQFNGVYDATKRGNACLQSNFQAPLMTNNSTLSEDCLYLYIHTPYNFDTKPKQLKNVMFWIHGGGLQAGTGNIYSGTLAKNKDIVVVSINYRLGIVGYLPNPELENSKTGNGGANMFLDMITALKWTKNNIESFGGNPNEITIAGESGGGWAVCGLLASPLAKGLFKQSIQMSGSCVESMGKFFNKDEAWKMAKDVLKNNNLTSFNQLKTADLQKIIDLHALSFSSMMPSVDGYVFPINPQILIENGFVNGESTMIGAIIRESFTEKPFNMGIPPKNFDDLDKWYNNYLFDTQINLLNKYYPRNDIAKVYDYGISEFDNNHATLIQTQMTTDCWVRCGSILQAEMLANNEIIKDSFDVYFYEYGYINKPYDQVSHGYDMIGLFGEDIAWLSGGVPFSEKFVKITQNYFGDYINGKSPMIDNKKATIQNGYYSQIVEKVNINNINGLNNLKERCKVYSLLGESFYRGPVCFGVDYKVVANPPESMEEMIGFEEQKQEI